jgi:HD-like signal output (HDOD) protein/ActR/RegA family two-component response regulator
MTPAVPRVLVIDDEESIRNLLRTTLQHCGYNVVDTESAAEGLKVLNAGGCDLVMVDILMPEMNGHAFMHAADQLPGRPPVIMMSGQAAVDDVVEGLHAGIDDFLTKPFSPREVAKTVGEVIRRHKQTAQGRDPATAGESLPFPESTAAAPPVRSRPAPDGPAADGGPSTTPKLMERIRAELESGRIALPMPEPLALQLTRSFVREDLEARDLVAVLEKSPQAAARVLHLARAPMYAARGLHAATLLEAVQRLGMRTAINAARTVLAREAIALTDGPFVRTAEKMWENAVTTAALARLLAYRTKVTAPELAYVIGLFHNIGELLLLRFSCELDGAGKSVTSSNDLAQEIILHHADLGYVLCKAWQLDNVTCAVAKRHHDPDVYEQSASDRSLRSLCSLIVLANHIAEEINGAALPMTPEVPTRERCEELLHVKRSALSTLIAEGKAFATELHRIFSQAEGD